MVCNNNCDKNNYYFRMWGFQAPMTKTPSPALNPKPHAAAPK